MSSSRSRHDSTDFFRLKGEMAEVVLSRDFELLEEIARLAQQDAPFSLAVTDPALAHKTVIAPALKQCARKN